MIETRDGRKEAERGSRHLIIKAFLVGVRNVSYLVAVFGQVVARENGERRGAVLFPLPQGRHDHTDRRRRFGQVSVQVALDKCVSLRGK